MEILRLTPTRPPSEPVTRNEPPKDLKIPAFKPDGFDFRSISTAPTPAEEKLGRKVIDFFKKAGQKLKDLVLPSPLEVLAKNWDPFRNRY